MRNGEFEFSFKPKFGYAFLRADIRNKLKVNKLPLADQLSLPQLTKPAIGDYPELAAALNAIRKDI